MLGHKKVGVIFSTCMCVLSVHMDFYFFCPCICIHANANAHVCFGQTDHLCVCSCICSVFNAPFDKSLSGQQGQGSGHLLCLPVGL